MYRGHEDIRFHQFMKNKILLELRLTENDTFSHVMEKGNTKKTHCALCLVGKTMFHCNLCNVSLYKTLKDKSHRFQSCFMIWHNKVDLIMEHNKMKLVYASRIAVRGRVRMEVNKCMSSEDDDNEGETDEEEEISEDEDEKMGSHNGNTQDQGMPSDDKDHNSDDNSIAELEE